MAHHPHKEELSFMGISLDRRIPPNVREMIRDLLIHEEGMEKQQVEQRSIESLDKEREGASVPPSKSNLQEKLFKESLRRQKLERAVAELRKVNMSLQQQLIEQQEK